jgi:hypothetical protein
MKRIQKDVPKDSIEEIILKTIEEHNSYIDYAIEDFKKKTQQLAASICYQTITALRKDETSFDVKELSRKINREIIKIILASL